MSGIEVAGLVLAVLPIFISAWENYSEALDPAKAFWSWERQLPEHIRALRDASTLYEMNIDALIAPVTTQAERQTLTDRSYSELWRDPDMQSRIADRLGKASSAFQSNMSQFESICRNIADCLDLEGVNAKSPVSQNKLDTLLDSISLRPTAERRFDLRRRAKFGWSKKRIKSLLAEMQRVNATMRDLTDLARRVEPYRTKKRPSALQHLDDVHNQACHLYSILSKAWACSRHPSHLAGIQLEWRLQSSEVHGRPQIRNGMPLRDCVLFRFAFSSSDVHPHPAKGIFRELEVATSHSSDKLVVAGGPLSPSPKTPQIKVSFAVDNEDDGSESDAEPLATVTDMCSTLQTHGSLERYGFYLDDTRQDLRGVYPAPQDEEVTFSGDAQLVRLEQVLSLERRKTSTRGLSLRQRVVLAVTLASSVLQLHSTAWLAQGWCKKAITFMRSRADDTVDAERPLLIQVFGQEPRRLEGAPASAKKKQAAMESKVALLTLGVVLLELYTGKTLESRADADEAGAALSLQGSWRTLELAKEWLEEEEENLSAARQTAVSFCLESFIGIRTNLNESEFRRMVHDEVVAPLQKEARDFLGVDMARGNASGR